MRDQPFDVIIFGATGFTGRLVAEVLTARCTAGDGPSWAMAGRSAAKLAQVRQSIGAPETVPLIEADASDAAALARLVAQARVVITTVGPYQLRGGAWGGARRRPATDTVGRCGKLV